MKIGHVAVWTDHLERLRNFYVDYFNGVSGEKYINTGKGFESYFVRFGGETDIEIMSRTDITFRNPDETLGWCHLAFTMEDREQVCRMTERLRAEGYAVLGEPRLTGDGFFESIVADPDGNRVELVAG